MSNDYRYLVVGNGLIGSAAARHLAHWHRSVAIAGPTEPVDPRTHTGVFSSHYDEGRLCRLLGPDPIWRTIAGRAIDQYPTLEARSGIRFHGPVGSIQALRLPPDQRRNRLDDLAGAELDVGGRLFAAGDRSWRSSFPMLELPNDHDVFYEPAPAGYINPRRLLAAQNAIAQTQGATIIGQRAVAIEASADGVDVILEDGSMIRAERALIACGAFTNGADLLPSPLPLRCKTETTIRAAVSPDTASALRRMPCVGYDIDHPALDDIYLAPPIRYPDGVHRIKMGCNTAGEAWPTSLDELQDWFRAGDSDVDLPAMGEALQGLLPDVAFEEVTSHRCIVTYTPSGYPIIDAAPGDEHGRLFVATGGNGAGAQGSDALGQLAAGLVHDGRWPHSFPRHQFLATNRWEEARPGRTKAQARATARPAARRRDQPPRSDPGGDLH